jgi:hypothetical protein
LRMRAYPPLVLRVDPRRPTLHEQLSIVPNLRPGACRMEVQCSHQACLALLVTES